VSTPADIAKYEAASLRYERALRDYPVIKAYAERLIEQANLEFEAASADLRQYETEPGIPKPEFNVFHLAAGPAAAPGG
jgi:hypothetical protein